MAFLVVLAVLALAVWLISAPLRAEPDDPQGEGEGAATAEADVAALEAAREAKYREIRDAELDFRTGKLSEADHRALERTLRAEAMDVLRRLDAARGGAQDSGQSTS